MNETLLANHLGALAVRLLDTVSQTSALSDSSRALLETLRFHAPLPATRLAAIAGLSQPATQRALDRLRDDGLVHWPDTGRTRPADLTPEGLRRADDLVATRDDVLRQATSALSAAEQAQLAPLLAKMLTTLTPSPEAARHMCRFSDHALCDGPACPVDTRARALSETP
ncbi:MarR family winged helix-turn-helix transcriptional regulator [Pseudooceanicola sp. C21-150M6]|uniref:MarR family winged helix-turn-helix transcriptional regulator n=1 Tax=Pseudooceanicola sp. C21-150M6 TaxID=3434355 RepID=UPI003D7FDF64